MKLLKKESRNMSITLLQRMCKGTEYKPFNVTPCNSGFKAFKTWLFDSFSQLKSSENRYKSFFDCLSVLSILLVL